ncbi:5799_t:CDS:10 [Funneliformis geosporum]|uniref:14255_t:CDS:1 n=1 Tax=Funneliformis geosporum TaxID=1117311 RepID=A0A9W4SK19_9GLOM|nr:14255_t:CDS:10 [Funneliformis geosporum]CAI2174291.1 5799_t:CDS:10 [Funneliformis geosporum]
MADGYRNLKIDDDEANYEEEDALKWRQQKTEKGTDEFIDRSEGKRMPDEVWLIPPHLSMVDILGEKRINLQRIEGSTNTHMIYNEQEAQIEMWGSRKEIEQAIKQWNALADSVLERQDKIRKKQKSKGWGKPEKYLNEKQKQKIERRKAREDVEKNYKGYPPEDKPFNGLFVLPISDIPVARIFGEQEQILDPLRIDTKCFIWFEPSANYIKVVGDSYGTVEEATTRVKNLYIKVLASRQIPHIIENKQSIYKGWVHHLMDPPHGNYKIKIAKPAAWFMLPYDITGEVRLLEPVYQGEIISIVGKEGALRELNSNSDFGISETIRESNVKTIETALFKALNTIYLFDEEAKMRIRFGHVCLTDFPKEELWPIEKFNNKVLNDSRLQSKFATGITNHRNALNPLLELLSNGNSKKSGPKQDDQEYYDQELEDQEDEESKLDYHELFATGEKKPPKRKYKYNPEWEGSPFREFKIRALRSSNQSDQKKDNPGPWPCTFEVQFKKDGKIGLWNATVDEKNVLDINMSCLDNEYSWKLNIKTAKRLSNDKFSAQGNFVYKLRVCPQNRLVYSNTDEITVVSVCEKTKWKYWWDKNTVIEVTRYEFWKLSKTMDNRPGIEVSLVRESAPNVSYGISFYKKSWDDHFAFNNNLNVGEEPEWHPDDIIEGGVETLMDEIRNFLEALQNKLPNNE